MSELDAGRADRDAGIEAVLAGACVVHRKDQDRVETALAVLARSGEPFNADTLNALIREVDPRPFNGLVLAGVMRHWASDGRIVEVWDRRQVQSARRSRHGAPLRWWRGTRAMEAAA